MTGRFGAASAPRGTFGFPPSCVAMTPNPDFEHFVRDYIRLAGQEQSLELRSRLLRLAREWMHAAMQEERKFEGASNARAFGSTRRNIGTLAKHRR